MINNFGGEAFQMEGSNTYGKQIIINKTMKPQLYIGIDSGTNTGLSVWDTSAKKLLSVECIKIHRAMEIVKVFYSFHSDRTIKVRVEDARLRTWFGKSGREQLQGAGSIKRDAVIWQDFLTDLGIPFEMVAPKNNKTKLTADAFKRLTGWQGKTNEHGRDSAMLIFGF